MITSTAQQLNSCTVCSAHPPAVALRLVALDRKVAPLSVTLGDEHALAALHRWPQWQKPFCREEVQTCIASWALSRRAVAQSTGSSTWPTSSSSEFSSAVADVPNCLVYRLGGAAIGGKEHEDFSVPFLWCCWCFYSHLDLAAAQVDVVDHHVPPHLQQISRSSKMKEAPLFKHLSKINRSSSYIKGSLSLIDQKIMRINIKHQTSRSKDLHTLPSPTPSPFSNLSCSSLFIRGRLEALWDLFSSFRGFVLGWDGMDIIGHRSS